MSADSLGALYDAVFGILNLEHPALAPVKRALGQGDRKEALDALFRHFTRRETPGWRMDEEERRQISQYVKWLCPDELEMVIRTADEVVKQTFLFRFPWDMERTRVPVTFQGDIDWRHIPDHDPEWTYMLNRHRYWVALGQAYAVTGDEKYASALCRQLEDWIERNPAPAEPVTDNPTWRTIEAGLRGANWIKALRYILDSPQFNSRFLAKVLISIHEHGRYLASAFTNWKRISNWGVLETSGLFQIALFFQEFRFAEQWRQLGLARLTQTAGIQVMPDGIHWEQSPTYHHEVLSCYLECIHFSWINGISLPALFQQAVHQMAVASLYWAKPNHRQPMLGDSDDSDVRSLLTSAAWLFQDPELRHGGYPTLDYDNAWLFGLEGIEQYSRMPAKEPARMSRPFPHSGHYVMRSGWSEEDLYLYFHCGPLGGGHGHADLLHFDLYAYGRDLLTDLGRYNYSDHTPLRKALKESTAHNTTLVDGIGFTEIEDTWSFGRIAKPLGSRWISTRGFDYVEAGHDGYFHLEDPVYPQRKIIFIKPYYWLLVDRFTCKEEHTFTQRFHFAPGTVTMDEKSLICRTTNEGEANLCIVPVHTDGLQGYISEGVISREYNLLEPNLHMTYSRSGKGTVSMMQVLFPQRPGMNEMPRVEKVPVFRHTGEQAEDAQAEACKIVLPETGIEHILVVSHRVPSVHADSYVVEGMQIFGEVVLISKTADGTEAAVII